MRSKRSPLGIHKAIFEHLDRNTQGYATGDGSIAINPMAAIPHKALFHEMTHVLLNQRAQPATVS